MKRAKRLCVFTLSFLILFSAFANLRLATAFSFPGGDQAHCLKGPGHCPGHSRHDHGRSSHKDKSPCHSGLLCCPSATEGTFHYSFALDSRPAPPIVILSRPIEIIESIYRPPKINI